MESPKKRSDKEEDEITPEMIERAKEVSLKISEKLRLEETVKKALEAAHNIKCSGEAKLFIPERVLKEIGVEYEKTIRGSSSYIVITDSRKKRERSDRP